MNQFFYRKSPTDRWVPICEIDFRVWQIRFISIQAVEFEGMGLLALGFDAVGL